MEKDVYKCDDGQELEFYRAGHWIFISGDFYDWVYDVATG